MAEIELRPARLLSQIRQHLDAQLPAQSAQHFGERRRRADEFFGAMDGGINTYKSENRGFFGPYANISLGLGG